MTNDRGPHRRPPAASQAAPRPQGNRMHRNEPNRPQNRPPDRTELPMAAPPPPDNDGLVYIAYAERDDDVAFELCDDIEEALGVYQIMKEDGFKPRLYQATEIEVVEDQDPT